MGLILWCCFPTLCVHLLTFLRNVYTAVYTVKMNWTLKQVVFIVYQDSFPRSVTLSFFRLWGVAGARGGSCPEYGSPRVGLVTVLQPGSWGSLLQLHSLGWLFSWVLVVARDWVTHFTSALAPSIIQEEASVPLQAFYSSCIKFKVFMISTWFTITL